MRVTNFAEEGFALEVLPPLKLDGFEVRLASKSQTRQTFEIVAIRALDHEMTSELLFETNHPESKRLIVPIRLKPTKE